VTLSGDMLTIERLTTSGPAAVAARDATTRGATLEGAVHRMLDLGGSILVHGANKATVDSVASQIDRLLETVDEVARKQLPAVLTKHVVDVNNAIEKHFDGGNVGSVQQQIAEIIRRASRDQQKELTKALFDNSGPLEALKNEMSGKVGSLVTRQDLLLKELTVVSERLITSKLVEDERNRGSAKGVVYEALVASVVEWAYAPHSDVVVEVGNDAGATGSKCGDIVVVLNPDDTRGQDRRVVVEAKARALSSPAALRELDQAMANREAQAGILVFAASDIAPLKGRAIRIYPGHRIVVVLDRESADPLALQIACAVARAFVLGSTSERVTDIDTARLEDHMERLAAVIDEAKAVARGVTAARKGIGQIDVAYTKLRNDAMAILSEMLSDIKVPASDTA